MCLRSVQILRIPSLLSLTKSLINKASLIKHKCYLRSFRLLRRREQECIWSTQKLSKRNQRIMYWASQSWVIRVLNLMALTLMSKQEDKGSWNKYHLKQSAIIYMTHASLPRRRKMMKAWLIVLEGNNRPKDRNFTKFKARKKTLWVPSLFLPNLKT